GRGGRRSSAVGAAGVAPRVALWRHGRLPRLGGAILRYPSRCEPSSRPPKLIPQNGPFRLQGLCSCKADCAQLLNLIVLARRHAWREFLVLRSIATGHSRYRATVSGSLTHTQ